MENQKVNLKKRRGTFLNKVAFLDEENVKSVILYVSIGGKNHGKF